MDVLSQSKIDELVEVLLHGQDYNAEIEIIEGSKEYEIAIRFKNLSPECQKALEASLSSLESFEANVLMGVRRTKTSLPSDWTIVE